MTTKSLLNNELQIIPKVIPEVQYSPKMLPSFREAMAAQVKLSDTSKLDVERREVLIPIDGQPDVQALLYVPKELSGAAFLHFHGGGFIIGSAEASDLQNSQLAADLGLVILSVNYRLAPEHPLPAPLDDAYASLKWLNDNADDLGIDVERIAVGGESAGAGLAAMLSIYNRDSGEFSICHQQLTFPMLDNLTGDQDHQGDPLVGEFVWTRSNNQFAWQSCLGQQPAKAPYVPARLESFEGLPPAWIHTVQLDLFRDENILYAQKLMRAGVKVELIVYPGACHGFQMIPNTKALDEYEKAHRAGLARGLGL